jgi:hypothetical protein
MTAWEGVAIGVEPLGVKTGGLGTGLKTLGRTEPEARVCSIIGTRGDPCSEGDEASSGTVLDAILFGRQEKALS